MAETGAEVMKENTRTQTQQPASGQAGNAAPGLKFPRYFTRAGISAYDEVEWELRTASITDAKGNTIFEQKDVESPKDWSMTAINIVASKYLHGSLISDKTGTPQRETGVRQLIQRVAETIRDWGWQQGYFATAEARNFPQDGQNSFAAQRAPAAPKMRGEQPDQGVTAVVIAPIRDDKRFFKTCSS